LGSKRRGHSRCAAPDRPLSAHRLNDRTDGPIRPLFQLRRTLLALGSKLARCRQPRLGRLRMGVVADIPSPAKRIWQPHTRRRTFDLGASFFRCGRTQTRLWAHSRTDEIGPSCQWATALGSPMALLLYIAPDTDATINSCFIGAFGNAHRCPRGCRWQLSVRNNDSVALLIARRSCSGLKSRPASAIIMVLHAHPTRCGGVPRPGSGLLRKYIPHASFISGHPVRIGGSVLEASASVCMRGRVEGRTACRARAACLLGARPSISNGGSHQFAACKLEVY
jgi:hypothetical protein